MKKFSIYIASGLLIVLIFASVLDFFYTKNYYNANPRTKFQYLRSLKGKKVDYIFLGSSRVENAIIPSVIYYKTHKKAVNLGFQAAKLIDIYTVLQLIKEYNIQSETILIQVDYIYNITNGNSNILQYQMIPFIRENEITKSYSNKYATSPKANYYIPFYRYANSDLKVGFREFFSNLMNKKTDIIANHGYVALQGNPEELTGSLPDFIVDSNPILDSIKSFSKQNNMNVVFYCAPFCKNNKNRIFTSKLKKKIPELHDFSRAINDDKLFQNCNHLNDSGAKRFTEILTDNLLMK